MNTDFTNKLIFCMFACLLVTGCARRDSEQSSASEETAVAETDAFTEAKVEKMIHIEPELSADSINARLSAAELPFKVAVEDSLMLAYPTFDCSFPAIDTKWDQEYFCEIAQIVFDGERWYRLTVTEDVVGLFYVNLLNAKEGFLVYTGEFNQQSEPYLFPDRHSSHVIDGEKRECIAIYYPERNCYDTVPLSYFFPE